MGVELGKLKGSRKVFEWHIANLQGEISDSLSHELNEQNKRLRNSLMKFTDKFERKSAELKDLTNKILTLLLEEDYKEKLSRNFRDDDIIINTLTLSCHDGGRYHIEASLLICIANQ